MNRLCEPVPGLTRLNALCGLSLVEPRGGSGAVFTAAVILGLTVSRRLLLTVIAGRLVHVVLHCSMWRTGLVGGNGGVSDADVAGSNDFDFSTPTPRHWSHDLSS